MTDAERIVEFVRLLAFPATEPQLAFLQWFLGDGTASSGPPALPPRTPEVLLLAGRGSGKTSLGAAAALYVAAHVPNAEVIAVSPSLEQTKSVLLGRVREYAAQLRPLLRRADFLLPGSNQTRLIFRNGSVIRFVPNKEAAVRGYGPRLVVLDEVASWPHRSADGGDLKTFLSAARARGHAQHRDRWRVLALTTPGRAHGPVYDWATAPGPAQCVVRAPTYQLRPDIPAVVFDKLPEVERRREVECEFGSTEDAPFDLDLLAACERAEIPAPRGRVILSVDPGFRRDFTGFTVASREGRGPIFVHALLRQRMHRDLAGFVPTVRALRDRWTPGEIVLDQFGGDPLVRLLRDNGIVARSIAWTGANRDQSFDALRLLLEGRDIALPANAALREEVAGLCVKYTPTGHRRIEHGAGHDDLVMSLLLAVQRLQASVPVKLWVDAPDPWARVTCGGIA